MIPTLKAHMGIFQTRSLTVVESLSVSHFLYSKVYALTLQGYYARLLELNKLQSLKWPST
jgi:hypothetical protein